MHFTKLNIMEETEWKYINNLRKQGMLNNKSAYLVLYPQFISLNFFQYNLMGL